MRLADHQSQWAELETAGGISAKPLAAIRRRVGAARRSAGAAGAALLRRQQGAVVRHHRRPAAISGISAGLVSLHPPLPGGGLLLPHLPRFRLRAPRFGGLKPVVARNASEGGLRG